MRKWMPAVSISGPRAGLLVVAAVISITGSVLLLQSHRPSSGEAGADLPVDAPVAPNESAVSSQQPENSAPASWKIPQAEPRDRSNRPLLELVGVYTGSGDNGTALIREKEGSAYTYRVGDRLPGDRELIEIHDSYVLLRNDEYIERLRLGSRAVERRYHADDLRSWAEQLSGESRGASAADGENR